MSGIAGIFELDGGSANRQELAHMTSVLTHRGSERTDVWTEGHIALGQCVFCATPESLHEQQPLVRLGQMVIVADARIDNKEELIESLGWSGYPIENISDSQIILGAYERWGEDSPRHLLGDFSFVVWDSDRQRLFCARDHLGIRPFYYVKSAKGLAFASEIKSLLTLSWVTRRLNETRVADFLMNMLEDKEVTFYEGILRLPPAHSLTVTPEGMHMRCYWALDPDREVRYSSDDEYAEAFREIFVEAVRCRIRSIHPLGSFLSGGLDSSSVTCVARSLLETDPEQPLNTFSLIFDEVTQSDERPYIDAVLEQSGLRPNYVHGDRLNLLDDLDRMLWHVDEPFFTPNLFLYWNLYRTAQAQGVRIVLDGFLGDNVVSHGTRYITELAATGRWVKMGREIYTIASVLGGRRKNSMRLMRDFVLAPLVMEPLQRAWSGLTKPDLPADSRSRFINKDFVRRVRWMERARAFNEEAPRTARSARQEHINDLTSGALPGALEIANKAAAAFGVMPRFPFADRRLMEFCLAVPADQKYQEGWTRVIARRGLRDYLPEKIRNRYGKTYLHPAFQHSLFVLARDEMSAFMQDRLPIAAPYLNVAALQETYHQILHQQKYGQYRGHEEMIVPICYAVILARWLEKERTRE